MLMVLENKSKPYLLNGNTCRRLTALNAAFKGSQNPFLCRTSLTHLSMPLNDDQNQEMRETSYRSLPRFCALEYEAQGLSRVPFIILLVLEDAQGSLRFLVRPDWRSVVQPEDSNYIESLLDDFLERAEEQPTPLFKQLCSLGVGPLVTKQTGEQISNYPHLLELRSRFVQL